MDDLRLTYAASAFGSLRTEATTPTPVPATSKIETPREKKAAPINWSKVKMFTPTQEDLDAHLVSPNAQRLLFEGGGNEEPDNSNVLMAIASGLKESTYTPEQCAGILLSDDFAGNAHIISRNDKRRQIARALGRAGNDAPAKSETAIKTEPSDLVKLWPRGFCGNVSPRDWQFSGIAMRGQVTMIYGAGGSAKSLWTIALATATGLGVEVIGYKPERSGNVLMLNAEDDVDEMRRRLWALRTTLKISDREMQILEERLFTMTRDRYVLVAKESKDAGIKRTEFYQQLRDTIATNNISLLIVDPLVSLTYGLDENSAEMQEIIDALRSIARDFNVPVLVVHHTSKSGQGGDQNAGRGSSVLSAASRQVITLNSMTEKESLLHSVPADKAWQHICVKRAKSNHGARGNVQWFKTVAVKMPSGEEVAVMEPVTFVTKSVLEEEWLPRFLKKIEAGRPNGDRYGQNGPKTSRADQLLIDEFKLEPRAAKAAIEELLREGMLEVRPYVRKSDRHDSNGLFVTGNVPEGGLSDDIPF